MKTDPLFADPFGDDRAKREGAADRLLSNSDFQSWLLAFRQDRLSLAVNSTTPQERLSALDAHRTMADFLGFIDAAKSRRART